MSYYSMHLRNLPSLLLVFLLLATGSFLNGHSFLLSDHARVSHLIILPGQELYSLWGHCALRVQDPERSYDQVYNYGTFNFSDPHFLGKFLAGTLNYFLSRERFGQTLWFYLQDEKRTILEQQLNLTHGQMQDIFDFLNENLQPENRYYRYDFLFDNCATRIRDLLEVTLQDALQYGPPTVKKETFREQISRYLDRRPGLDFSFALLLGPRVDRPVGLREKMFLPLDLMAVLDRSRIRKSPEITAPLVTGTRENPAPQRPPDHRPFWNPLRLAWGLLLLALALTLFPLLVRRRGLLKIRRILLKTLDFLLFLFLGLVGILILYLWFFSRHTVADHNLNLAFAFPLHLAAAFLLLGNQKARTLLRRYCLASIGLVVTGLVLRLWIPQFVHPAFAPLLMLLVLRCGARSLKPGRFF